MTTFINASTSAGLVQTADTSGNLSLQSGGTTILALTSASAAVTGTLSATGNTSVGTAAQSSWKNLLLSDYATNASASATAQLILSSTSYYLGIGNKSSAWIFGEANGIAAGSLMSNTWLTVGATGTAVTGTLSATAPIALSDGTVAATALRFTSMNAGSGLYSSGGNSFDAAINGTYRTRWTTVGFEVNGALSKSSGTFKIDHPLAALTDTHQLVHSFIEGPQADLIYRGKVLLVDGKATVNIDAAATMTDGTFDVLCRDVQCFTTNESDWTPVRGAVVGNTLTIESQDPAATSSISWMVIGERKDKHIMETDWTDDNGKAIVEPAKLEAK